MIDTRDDVSEVESLIDAGLLDDLVDGMSDGEARELWYRWSFWRRPDQRIPAGMGDRFQVWFQRAGRGAGKTRTGAETTREMVEHMPLIALVGPTAGDVRDIIVEGESGVLSVFPHHQRPDYEPSKRRITFHTGARAQLFSGEEPERLRGPQFHWAWIDEIASMDHGEAVWDNLSFGMRLGNAPWTLLTGTPKRLQWLQDLEAEPTTIVTRGSTYRNQANLSHVFIRRMLGKYEGTRLGAQELHGDYLDDVEGALWRQQIIDLFRVDRGDWDVTQPAQSMRRWLAATGRVVPLDRRAWRTIVAVDPPGETAECGIIVGQGPVNGVAGEDHVAIVADESRAGRPEEWGQAVVAAYRHWGAQAVYVESNQGGDMVRSTIHAVDPTVKVEKIRAVESKKARAEPISALHEKGWLHHVGFFPQLEAQQTGWVPDESRSPDRLDAFVHCVRELIPDRSFGHSRVSSPVSRRIPTRPRR